MRVTPQLVAVLGALLDAPGREAHGFALMRATGLGGASVYRNLERCETAGLVTARWADREEPGKPRRRLYRLTPDGAVRAGQLVAGRASGWGAPRPRPAGGVA
jgi:PadR family transcriptional regulator PadR